MKIPVQEITYFDTTRQSYVTLKTKPLQVSIIPSNGSSAPKPPQQNDGDPQKSSVTQAVNNDSTKQKVTENLLLLDKDGAWNEIPHHSMSWKWFFLLIMLSLVYAGRFALRSCGAYFQKYYGALLTKKHAFSRAKKQIKNLRSSDQLYALFLELIANRTGLPASSLSQQNIEEMLNKAGMSSSELDSWNNFFTLLAASVYSEQHGGDDIHVLFDQAQKWLERLEKVL